MRCLSVIVHHRGNEILTRCLESLLAEGAPEDRIIVFANGLEEPLPEACNHPTIITGGADVGLGFSEANNRAVAQAKESLGDFDCYLFINNDARLEDGALALLKQHLRSHPQCAIVGPKLVIECSPEHINSLGLNVTRQGQAWDEGIGILQSDYGALPSTQEVLAITGAALLMRSRDYHRLGGWSTVFGYYFEDIDLCIRAWRANLTVMIEPSAVGTHAISASTGPVSRFKTFHSWRNQFVLLFLHWPMPLLVLVLPRLVVQEILLYFKRRKVGAVDDAQLQLKALIGAIRLIPSTLLRRYKGGTRTRWVRFLRPSGSVPVINLPHPTTEGDA